jgi:hypothetical protein
MLFNKGICEVLISDALSELEVFGGHLPLAGALIFIHIFLYWFLHARRRSLIPPNLRRLRFVGNRDDRYLGVNLRERSGQPQQYSV